MNQIELADMGFIRSVTGYTCFDKISKLVVGYNSLHHTTSFFIPLNAVLGVEELQRTIYTSTDTTGGPPLTYGQQNAGASSEDNPTSFSLSCILIFFSDLGLAFPLFKWIISGLDSADEDNWIVT